jgi:hypothetical protein
VADAPAAVKMEADGYLHEAVALQQIPGLQNGVGTAPLGAEHAPQGAMAVAPVKEESAAANAADAALQGAAVAAAAEPERKRRHKWGPPAAGEFAREEQRPKKRRSRWESNTDIVVATSNSGQIIIPGQLPKEVTICGGMKVSGLAVLAAVGRAGCLCVGQGGGGGASPVRQAGFWLVVGHY